MVQLVSAVGGGKLSRELALDKLALDLDAAQVQYDPSQYHGIIARFSETGPAILIYNSGGFSISGAESLDQLFKSFDEFEDNMKKLLNGIEYENEFEIRNLVHRTEIPVEETGGSLNLNALAIGLEVECVEYEPEQFPGLMYRPPSLSGLYLIFASGALVSTGHSNPDTALEEIEKISNRVLKLLRVE